MRVTRTASAPFAVPWCGFIIAGALLLGAAPARPDVANDDIRVEVTTRAGVILVHVDCPVPAPPRYAWDVITDFDHMARFLSHLKSSRSEALDDSHKRVHQEGVAQHGPFQFRFSNTREVELVANSRVHAVFVSGDLQQSESDTYLVTTQSGSRIINEGRFVSDISVPPLIGPAIIASETRRQFREIRAEILRRSASRTISAGPPPDAADDVTKR